MWSFVGLCVSCFSFYYLQDYICVVSFLEQNHCFHRGYIFERIIAGFVGFSFTYYFNGFLLILTNGFIDYIVSPHLNFSVTSSFFGRNMIVFYSRWDFILFLKKQQHVNQSAKLPLITPEGSALREIGALNLVGKRTQ